MALKTMNVKILYLKRINVSLFRGEHCIVCDSSAIFHAFLRLGNWRENYSRIYAVSNVGALKYCITTAQLLSINALHRNIKAWFQNEA